MLPAPNCLDPDLPPGLPRMHMPVVGATSATPARGAARGLTCVPQRVRTMRPLFAIVVAIGYLAFAAAVDAQVPGVPSLTPQREAGAPGKQPTDPSFAEASADGKARVAKQLAEVRAELELPFQPAPGNIAVAEQSTRRDVLSILAYAYESQMRAYDELVRARGQRTAAEAADHAWTGFSEPPPYPVRMVDELRDTADAARARLAAIDAAIRHLEGELARMLEATKRSDEAVRRADEALDAARDDIARAEAAWRRDFAALQLRAANARATFVRLARDGRRDELAARQADLRRLERQIAVAAGAMRFDTSDLAQARQRLKGVNEGFARDLVALRRELAERTRQRDEATHARARVTPGSAEAQVADARLRAAQAWVDAVTVENEIVAGLQTLGDAMAQMWTQRHILVTADDIGARRAAAQRIRQGIEALTPWKVYLDSLVQESRSRLRATESRLAQGDQDPAAAHFEGDVAKAEWRAVTTQEHAKGAIENALHALDRWVADARKAEAAQGWRERALDAGFALRDGIRAVWNFEVLTVDDTTVVDGRTVTTTRGVTIGKSAGALLLFLFGLWVTAKLSRRVARSLVGRGFDAARVRTIRRWVMAMAALALVLLTLNVARIPLTVFAFLGGALAIGVGFGTQTIIKNFISGMIVLMERRVQVGDIVDVDGINGVVTSVDLRSTTVRSPDGLETLVPNSALLENNVTNWTLSDRKVRRTVKVGVAYGTPMRDAAELIEDIARRHGNVLADPAPNVVFEDFGDSAQVLTLYFWVELSPKVNAMQVASDLRFMIEKRLAEADIVMPCPQRDVHLDAGRPLEVKVISGDVTGTTGTGQGRA